VLQQIFGVGNDWIFSFCNHITFSSYDLFNDITGLDMNDWNKVEKRKKRVTDEDIRWEYVKMFFIIVTAYLYFHFVIMGW